MKVAHIQEALQVIDNLQNAAQQMIDNLAAKEAECLMTIHSRYCILKGIPIDRRAVTRYIPDERLRPQYWEYWLNWNKPGEYFLMSRDVTSNEKGELSLKIAFNKELVREGE